MKSKMFSIKTINVPNTITFFRIFLAMVSVSMLMMSDFSYRLAGFLLSFFNYFVLDFFDGYLARKLKQETFLGKFLDQAGDRFFKVFLLLVLLFKGYVPLELVVFHLAVKNQFFELPVYFLEGYFKNFDNLKKHLPLYAAVAYYKPWIRFWVVAFMFTQFVFFLIGEKIIPSRYYYEIAWAVYFFIILVRVLPVYEVYAFIAKKKL